MSIQYLNESSNVVIVRRVSVVILLFMILLIAGCAGVGVLQKQSFEIRPEEIPHEVRDLYYEAEKAFKERDMERAMSLYCMIKSQVPSGKIAYWSYLRIGEIFFEQGMYPDAIKQFQSVTEIDAGAPLYNLARLNLARCYSKLGRYSESNDILKTLIYQEVAFQKRARIESLIGDNFLSIKENHEALTWYMKALERNPDGELASLIKGNIENIINHVLTIPQLEEVSKKHGWNYPSGYILYALAASYYDNGEVEKAKESLEEFLGHYKEHAYYDEGMRLEKRLNEVTEADRNAVGCILPLTGEYAAFGNRVLDAIVLATGIFNQELAVDIKLIIEDSQSNSAIAGKAVSKLVNEDKVIGIVGPLEGTAAIEAAKEAQKYMVPLITITPREGVAEVGDYVFRNFVTSRMQVRTLVKYSVENLGMKSFAILYPDDKYGTEMMNLFWDEVLQWGGEIRAVESYGNEQTDFGKEIKALTGINYLEKDAVKTDENSKPIIDFDALFIPDSHSKVAMIAPQLAFYDVTGIQLLGTSAWNSHELLKSDSEYIEGSIFVDGFFIDSFYPEVRDFIDRFYAACGREPDYLEALAYDATRIMVTILNNNNVEIRAELKSELFELQEYQGVTGKTFFSASGDAEKNLYVLMVRNNEIIQIH